MQNIKITEIYYFIPTFGQCQNSRKKNRNACYFHLANTLVTIYNISFKKFREKILISRSIKCGIPFSFLMSLKFSM